jgi:hypothetical protein
VDGQHAEPGGGALGPGRAGGAAGAVEADVDAWLAVRSGLDPPA